MGTCIRKGGFVLMKSTLKILSWVGIGALAGSLTTVSLQSGARGNFSPLPMDALQQFATIYSIIKSDYVEPTDDETLMTNAISGMVSNLDPHSQYFDKKTYKEFREGTTGRFVGVGIEITQEDGFVKIVSPIEGSPAERAGLMAQDLITQVDATPLKGLSLNDAVKLMRGLPNTQVVLSVLRRSENNRSFKVTITRELIKTVSVKAKVVQPGYAWVRVSQFQERTLQDLTAKLTQIAKDEPKLKGLVLDLRNDPGGLLDVAVGVATIFLPTDAVVVSTNGQLEESKFTFKASPGYYWRRSNGSDLVVELERVSKGLFKRVPLTILVNEGSASASEIVAGALQDHKRATLLGARTFGKGSVQTVRPLTPETAVKITTARYYTPSGKSIQAKGIDPDIWLDDTAEGSPFAVLRTRESDLAKHLNSGQGGDEQPSEALRQEREQALKRLEEENRKSPGRARLPEFGSDKDFQLQQALNHLKGQPVKASKDREQLANADRKTEAPRK
jgi:carboxyl-terminal processing protease